MRLGSHRSRWKGVHLWLATALCVCACSPRPTALERIEARGVLRVVTLNSPTTWYQGAHGPQGAQFELATAFAKRLGKPLSMYAVADIAALRAELAAGRADIVAAAISADQRWQHVGLACKPYESIPQLVVFKRGNKRPANLAALRHARVAVSAGSPQVAILESLRQANAPYLTWREVSHDEDDPVAQVSSGNADFAIVDGDEFAFARQLYPDVNIGLRLPVERAAQWIVPRGAQDLAARVEAFFVALLTEPQYAALFASINAGAPEFHYQTAAGFQSDIDARLPQLQPWFEQAGQQSGVDWRLLAAIGYQESKWQPDAASGDGARGVMMLTQDTASSLGVTNRDDPQQSIIAGAKYFAQTRAKIPARIPEPDRSWMTLAAYNVGFGHLEDARVLAQSRGKNPDAWVDVATSLPLLAQERWYQKAKHGYARGWEPVRQVEQVQFYLNVLEWGATSR